NECKEQEEKDSVNNTNRVNVVSLTVNAARNEINVVGRKSSTELLEDPNMPELEDISIFEDSNEDVFGAEADLKNLESTFQTNWLFDINALTKSMNYKLVVVGNQSNGNAGTKACNDAGKARVETVPGKDYILLSLWTTDLPFPQEPKSSQDAGFKPFNDVEKKVNEVLRQ
nr:hypothetical protein [Tanacetum cinerariifolium]